MADHNDPRYRADDPYDQDPAQDRYAEPVRDYDPIADLARLINGEAIEDRNRGGYGSYDDGYDQYQGNPGQGGAAADPYEAPAAASYYADARQQAPFAGAAQHGWSHGHPDGRYDAQEPGRPSGVAPDYDDGWPQPRSASVQAPAYGAFAASGYPAPADDPHDPQAHDPQAHAPRAYADPRQSWQPAHAPAYGRQAPAPQAFPGAAPQGFAMAGPPRDGGVPVAPTDPYLPAGYAEAGYPQAGYAEGDYADASGAQAAVADAPAALPPFLTSGQQPPDDFYDDAPDEPPRRRMMLVAIVVGLALLGTAGAFAYRTMFTGPSGPPPIIRASTEPTKVDPPQQKGEDDAAGIAFNRFGHRGQDEKVVPRQETPVDLSSLVSASPQAQMGGQEGEPGRPPNVLSDPRSVRSIPIRPDEALGGEPQVMPSITPQSVVSSPPFAPGRSANASRQGAAGSQPRVANAEPADGPLNVVPPPRNSSPPAQQAAAPAAQQRVASGPLSLVPGGASQPSSQRQASPPARVASAPASGGFAVQVSARRNEADAQRAYRALQSRYSSVLAGQSSFVRRADLGDRGVYYRSLIGPFGTREEAVDLCARLKAAGGDCLVQSN